MSAEQRDSIIRRVLRGVGFLAMVFTLCYCQIEGTPISEGFWGVIGVMFTFFYTAEAAESEGSNV